MIEMLRRFFLAGEKEGGITTIAEIGHDLRIAACALLLEMANIDGEFSPKEVRVLLNILHKDFGLWPKLARQLTRETADELYHSINMWQFTNLINENYSIDEKMEIVEMIWQVVYQSGNFLEHESYLQHKLAALLDIGYRELSTSKVRIFNRSVVAIMN